MAQAMLSRQDIWRENNQVHCLIFGENEKGQKTEDDRYNDFFLGMSVCLLTVSEVVITTAQFTVSKWTPT